ncbi:MAG: hypothetical protein OHK0040_14080 [bacterium]
MTLGAFTGYFRDRKSKKNITFPYDEYLGHFVLGVIYSRTDGHLDERKIYHIDDLRNITSVVKDFVFFVQEKYKIAIDRPGSGNTKNIGSVTKIEELINGEVHLQNLEKQFLMITGCSISPKIWQRLLSLKALRIKILRNICNIKSSGRSGDGKFSEKADGFS